MGVTWLRNSFPWRNCQNLNLVCILLEWTTGVTYIAGRDDLDIPWPRESSVCRCPQGTDFPLCDLVLDFLINVQEASDGSKQVPALLYRSSDNFEEEGEIEDVLS